MKTLRCAFVCVCILIGLTSVCMAEDWYAGMEKSSNDYSGSVGAMVAEVDGSKYTPDYTSAELKDTRAAADTRQFAQSGAAVAQTDYKASGSTGSVETGSNVALPISGGSPGPK